MTAALGSRNLTKAVERRAVIGQAKGALTSTRRIDADAAFDLLRQRSQTSNPRLVTSRSTWSNETTAGGDDDPHPGVEAARRRLGHSYMDLWIDYFALGGNLDVDQLAFLPG